MTLRFREKSDDFPRDNRMTLAALWAAASAMHRVSAADVHRVNCCVAARDGARGYAVLADENLTKAVIGREWRTKIPFHTKQRGGSKEPPRVV